MLVHATMAAASGWMSRNSSRTNAISSPIVIRPVATLAPTGAEHGQEGALDGDPGQRLDHRLDPGHPQLAS